MTKKNINNSCNKESYQNAQHAPAFPNSGTSSQQCTPILTDISNVTHIAPFHHHQDQYGRNKRVRFEMQYIINLFNSFNDTVVGHSTTHAVCLPYNSPNTIAFTSQRLSTSTIHDHSHANSHFSTATLSSEDDNTNFDSDHDLVVESDSEKPDVVEPLLDPNLQCMLNLTYSNLLF